MSGITQHAREGNRLRPPLMRMPTNPSSWADDHMPEMLWAVLLTNAWARKEYLGCFRAILNACYKWIGETIKENQTEDEVRQLNYTLLLDHTKLAELSDEQFKTFIAPILSHPYGAAALRPLLLITSLPNYGRWASTLQISPLDDDWEILASAIAGVLDHQSEESTDIRWFKLMLPIMAGKMHYPESYKESLEEILQFPDKGDMRSVRPSIRSSEMMLRRNPPSKWIQSFWSETLFSTPCIDPSEASEYEISDTRIISKSLYAAREELIDRFYQAIKPDRADARLDSSFGMVLYALSIVEEIAMHRIQNRTVGRMALRTLVEISITLKYLAQKDDPNLWKTYRVYGAGQAKLAFLKAQEIEGDLPKFLDEDTLHAIANEDIWQEFLDIDIGHWSNSNLRKIALECGAKDTYDQYYDWTSSYTHGHWGPIRDSNFITCHNPLHRLHRIPRTIHRRLNSVEDDAILLTNQMLDLLDSLYVGESPLPKVTMKGSA